MSLEKKRVDKSREKLVQAFQFALGTYTDQEGNRHYPKGDEWRDREIGDLFKHLEHEIEEIKRNINSDDLNYLLHNSADAVGLSCMLLAKIMNKADVSVDSIAKGSQKKMDNG